MTVRVLALAALLLSAAPLPLRTLVVHVDPALGAEHRRGVEFGLAESRHTARLMDHDVTLGDGPGLVGRIVASRVTATAGNVPTLVLSAPPAGACTFAVGAAPTSPADVVVWHHSLARYGASEVNERYQKAFGTRMTAEAWLGWFAVKAIVENALRAGEDADLCASMSTMKFDGHKGRPLSFDPDTRILRQPLYVVSGDRVVGEKQ